MPPPAQEPPHASVDVPASMHAVQASTTVEQPHAKLAAFKSTAKRFFCRLDVCGTLVFFLFLVVAATASTAPTQNYVFKALKSSWDDTHATKVANTAAVYERLAGRMYRLAASSMSLRSNTPYDMDNEQTLATLCTTLARYDTIMRFTSFSVWSPNLGATTGCMHGDPEMPSLRTLTGYITGEDGINGTYLVDPRTFLFQRPFVKTSNFTISRESVMERVHSIYTSTPLFEAAARYYNGSIDSIDPKTMWTPDPPAPHLLFFNLPAALMLRGLNIDAGPNISSFLRLALNGLTLAKSTHFSLQAGEKLAVFINASLSDEDPLIMSNSWGQTDLVQDTSLFDNLEHLPLPYLRSSSVSDPLMRTALKHVNLKALQADGSRKAAIFRYKGAFATVTAWSYVTAKGLTVPFVYVSPQIAILPPHLLYAQVVTGLLVAAILVLSALYWSYLHFRFTRPLRRMSELLHRGVATGQRVMFHQERHFFFRNTEVEEVVAAHNSCMRRLREIDSFVPRCLRASPTGSVGGDTAAAQPTRDSIFRGAAAEAESSAAAHPTLMPQQSTVVTVTVRPRPAAQQAPAAIAVRVAQWRAHRASSPAQLLDRVVATAASASNMVNSGPFPTPAALEAFASAVNDLAERHHGTTLRFAPDGCVVHFGAAVRTHLLSAAVAAAQAAPGRRADRTPEECLHAAVVRRRAVACGRRDAADAVAFALALQAWVDQRRRTRMPDVRLLLDTSTFVCGLYRNEWSGQVIPVALGRDVHREVGHVPAALGVRVAMTEETANLVRARVCGSNTRKLEAGVRQLPVEALRTGRVGLNADVVILYEVLPGSVAGCAPWQRYQRCCFDGFGFMVHGDYAAALGAFKQVADIADLEPGLVPSSLRREAASSAVVGGAVSVQVQRLMNECELRVRAGATDGFRRTRLCPLGIDTVLRGHDYDPRQSTPQRAPPARASAHTTTTIPATGAAACPARAVREEGPGSPTLRTPDLRVERAVLTAHRADGTATRYVLGGKPERVEDNHGCFWCVPTSPNHMLWADPWNTAVPVLGSAGVLCTMTVMPLSETPAEVAAALRGVPDGAMSDAVRRAVPLCVPTPRMRAAAERLYIKQQAIPHPNLLAPLAYSFSLEGALALVTECQPGGTLRALCHRYGALRPLTLARFTVDILAGLAGLHSLGLAHGALSLDNVVVGDAGVCRLRHHYLQSRQSAQLLRVPATVYVSPATAAGQPPTPACDVFCYGLLCIEAAGRQPCWRWADAEEGAGCDGDAAARAKALRELLRRAGQPFHDAVVQRRVVPAVESLRTPAGMRYLTVADRDTLRRCFSYDAAERPTAAQLRHVGLGILARHGFGEVPDELWEANT